MNTYFKSDNFYKRLQFLPNKPLQNREVNDLQETLINELKILYDCLYSDGTLIFGGTLKTEEEVSDGYVYLSISEGYIPYKGVIIVSPDTEVNIPISKIGDTIVGIEVATKIVTSDEDITLKSPAYDTKYYFSPGGDVTKITGTWKLEKDKNENNDFFPIYFFIDGKIDDEKGAANTDEVRSYKKAHKLIANNDYRTKGDYVIEGMEVKPERLTSEGFSIIVGQGRAHVKGYEFSFNSDTKITLPPVTGFVTVDLEPFNYYEGTDTYNLRSYPIKRITRVVGGKREIQYPELTFNGTLEEDYYQVLGEKSSGYDRLVVSIVQVRRGSTIFTKGTDYVFAPQGSSVIGNDANSILWLASRTNDPGIGNRYQVTYDFQVIDDYNLNSSFDIPVTVSDNYKSIEFIGSKPYNGATIQISYEFYTQRIDMIVLSSQGQLTFVEGDYLIRNPSPPLLKNKGLPLASVSLQYNELPFVNQNFDRVMKVAAIQDLFGRLHSLEYNVGQIALHIAATNQESATTIFNGMFVDNFVDRRLRDSSMELGIAEDEKFIVETIDNTLHIVPVWYNSLVKYSGRNEDPILMSFEVINTLKQEFYTRDRRVNELLWQGAPPGQMSIEPSVYRWTEKKSKRLMTRLTTISGRTGEVFRERELEPDLAFRPLLGEREDSTETLTWTTQEEATEVLNLPPLWIKLEGDGYSGGEVVNITFDNLVFGDLTCTEEGTFAGELLTPEKALSGSKEIKAIGSVSKVESMAVFQSIPTVETTMSQTTTTLIRDFVQNISSFPWSRVRVLNDPLAQLFEVSQDCMCENIQIQLEVLPDTKLTGFLDVFIVHTLVGMPLRDEVIASSRLRGWKGDPNQLQPDSNGWVTFSFTPPRPLEKGVTYCFVVESTDLKVSCRVAHIGENDQNDTKVTGQLYDIGVLLQSSNSRTWDPIQLEDFCFKLNSCQFQTGVEQIIKVGDIDTSNIYLGKNSLGIDIYEDMGFCTDLCLMAGIEIPENSKLIFEVILVDRNEKHEALSYLPINFKKYSGLITVNAILYTDNKLMSPLIEGVPTCNLGKIEIINPDSTPCVYYYVSREWDTKLSSDISVNLQANSPSVKVYLDVKEPGLSKFRLFFEKLNDEWVELERKGNGKNIGQGYIEVEFESINPNEVLGLQSTRVKIEAYIYDEKDRPTAKKLRAFVSS